LTYFVFFFKAPACFPRLLAYAEDIFQDIITTAALENARVLSTVVARETRTTLKQKPIVTKHAQVSIIWRYSQ